MSGWLPIPNPNIVYWKRKRQTVRSHRKQLHGAAKQTTSGKQNGGKIDRAIFGWKLYVNSADTRDRNSYVFSCTARFRLPVFSFAIPSLVSRLHVRVLLFVPFIHTHSPGSLARSLFLLAFYSYFPNVRALRFKRNMHQYIVSSRKNRQSYTMRLARWKAAITMCIALKTYELSRIGARIDSIDSAIFSSVHWAEWLMRGYRQRHLSIIISNDTNRIRPGDNEPICTDMKATADKQPLCSWRDFLNIDSI